MARPNSFSSAILSVSIARVIHIIAGVLFIPLLVRLLSPSEFGYYATILAVFGIVNILMSTGTNAALQKFIPERSEKNWQATVFGFVFRAACGLSLITACGLILAAWTGIAAMVFGTPFTNLFYLLGVFAIGRQLREVLRRTLMGLQLETRSEPLWATQRVLFPTLALAAAYLGYGVEGILVADIITSIIIVTVGFILVGLELPLRSIVVPSSTDLPRKDICIYAASSVLFFLFLTSLYHVDILLLQYWASSDTVGYYKGALSIAEILWFAPMVIQMTLLQRISKDWKSGNIKAIQQKSSMITRYVFLFTVLLAIGLGTLAGDFVPLYLGEDFRPAIFPLILLLPGVIGFAAARPTLAINQARRSLRPLIAATAACSAVNLVFNFLLIPLYGMIGAAIATSIGYGSLIIFQSVAARHLGYDPFAELRPRRLGLLFSISAVFIVSFSILIQSSVLSLLTVPPVGFLIYAVLAIMTGAISPDEVRTLTSHLPARFEKPLLAATYHIPRLPDP